MTLIGAAAGGGALTGIVEDIAGTLSAKPDWLASAVACDLPFDEIDAAAAEAIARQAIGAAAIDVLVQPLEGRRKRLLAADLESTIIENEMLDELADFVGMRAE